MVLTPNYLFILDSRQLEATVGSNDLFISCHVLGSVDVMLRFIHAVGLLKLAVLVPVHACTQQIILVMYVVCTHSSIFVVPSIICGASYHVWDLPSVIICDDVAKDPSDRLSLLTSAKSYISESRYLARYYPAYIPWPMTLAPTNEAISREISRKKNLIV